jgi:zinc D-Ala-D-Ala carboxypeptidase
MGNISKNITYAEATKSQTAVRRGIVNTPNDAQLEAMKLVAEKVFEPLREWYGSPIRVSSFFRNDALNKAVKGSKTSQHVKGEAIDLDLGSVEENKKLFDYIKDNLEYDQLIWEYDGAWVHVSYSATHNRKQTFSIG